MTAGLRLGAPGVYHLPPGKDRRLRAIALDVAGFAGIAPRGPVDVPVPVESWPEYLARFGLGPGLLPLAVSAFFAQGGRRAHVLRVGPPPRDDASTRIEQGTTSAEGVWTALTTTLGDRVRWIARDEGAWGDLLTVTLSARVRQRFVVRGAASSLALAPEVITGGGTDRLVEPPGGVQAPEGSLLHVRRMGGRTEIRWIESSSRREISAGVSGTTWLLDAPLPADALSVGLVDASVTVDDHASEGPSVETFDVGLSPRHPRWLASVLDSGSNLVTPDPGWSTRALELDGRIVLMDPLLPPIGSSVVDPGLDRYGEIGEENLLGRPAHELPDDDPSGESPHRGVERLARVEELGLLAVPDLAWDGVSPEEMIEEPPDRPPDGFTRCTGPLSPARLRVPGVEAVYLDARLPAQLSTLRGRQQWLVQLADVTRRFVVLLDVPLGLSTSAVADWRAAFDSSYAAGYYPWLGVPSPLPAVASSVPVARAAPPSAFAAGIIAARELEVGLATGPANRIAVGAVTILERVTDAEHDALHPLGINVFRAERDGFRLTAARTLSRDRDYRQLTVRRLMTMLRLTLDRESQWVVFEPHTAALRAVLVLHVSDLLHGQFLTGAFAGATEAESYFVRAGDDLNPPESIALGRIVLEVGVAPSEPLEFLVLRITRDGDAVDVEEATLG